MMVFSSIRQACERFRPAEPGRAVQGSARIKVACSRAIPNRPTGWRRIGHDGLARGHAYHLRSQHKAWNTISAPNHNSVEFNDCPVDSSRPSDWKETQSRVKETQSRVLSIHNPQINLSTASDMPRRDDENSLRARAADASELRTSPALMY
jgi:hypothetical protein